MTWPMVLLLAGIGAMALVAWQANRATRSHRALAANVISDYAKFAAWSYEHPYPAVAEIAGHLAFYPDKVRIERIPFG